MGDDCDLPRGNQIAETDDRCPLLLVVHGQTRHERNAETGGGEALHDLVVVGLKDDVELGAEGAQRTERGVDGARRAEAHEVELPDVGCLEALRRELARNVDLRHEHPWVVEDDRRRKRAGRQRQIGEDEIEASALERPEELEVEGRVLDGDAHERVLLAEAADDVGQEPRPDALEGADAKRTDGAVRERLDVGLRR
jgi:hypothetical protein